jgi:hypothetical protein
MARASPLVTMVVFTVHLPAWNMMVDSRFSLALCWYPATVWLCSVE